MNFFTAIILGIVEGVTEFLPVSSTAHLILASKLIGLFQTDFLKTFEIAIQLGAILAVVILYWGQLSVNFKIVRLMFAAFLPTAVIGLGMYKVVKNVFMESDNLILWALLIGGVFLVIFESFYRQKDTDVSRMEDISYRQALVVGVFQSLAILPGVSRSAATIIGGLCLGLKRKAIVEFSFMLAIPTMLAATGLDLVKNAHSFSFQHMFLLAAGFIASFLTAVACIKFLLIFIKNNNFIIFGVYRVVLAIVILMALNK